MNAPATASACAGLIFSFSNKNEKIITKERRHLIQHRCIRQHQMIHRIEITQDSHRTECCTQNHIFQISLFDFKSILTSYDHDQRNKKSYQISEKSSSVPKADHRITLRNAFMNANDNADNVIKKYSFVSGIHKLTLPHDLFFYILRYIIYLTTKNFLKLLDLILYPTIAILDTFVQLFPDYNFYIVAFPHKTTYLLIEFQRGYDKIFLDNERRNAT